MLLVRPEDEHGVLDVRAGGEGTDDHVSDQAEHHKDARSGEAHPESRFAGAKLFYLHGQTPPFPAVSFAGSFRLGRKHIDKFWQKRSPQASFQVVDRPQLGRRSLFAGKVLRYKA